jgi:hypothetical protein
MSEADIVVNAGHPGLAADIGWQWLINGLAGMKMS